MAAPSNSFRHFIRYWRNDKSWRLTIYRFVRSLLSLPSLDGHRHHHRRDFILRGDELNLRNHLVALGLDRQVAHLLLAHHEGELRPRHVYLPDVIGEMHPVEQLVVLGL